MPKGKLIVALAVIAAAREASAGVEAVRGPSDAPSLERRFDDALEATRSLDFSAARALAEERIAADPGDWKGWYLLALADRGRALEGREAELARVKDARRLEEIRLLVRYLASSGSDRESVARRAVEADPGSAIAHALLASAMVRGGRLREAVDLAEAALALDPNLVLAARVLARSLGSSDEGEGRDAACRLLLRFPYDSVVTDFALGRCAFPEGLGSRLHLLSGVLAERRGTPQARKAAHLLLSGRVMESAASADLERVIALLDPRDDAWWPRSDGLLHAFLRVAPRTAGRAGDGFFESLYLAAGSAPNVNVELVRLSSLVLARRLQAAGRIAEAIEVLRSALARVPKLRRADHYEALGAMLDGVGRAAEAEAARASARRIFQPAPPGRGDENDVFPILDLPVLMASDGTERRWRPRRGRSTIVLYWDADCAPSRQVAAQLAAAHAAGSPPFAAHEVDVLWLRRRAPSEVADFERKVRELGLDPAALVFPGTETDNVLSRGFGVSGTPWLALAMPDGRVVHEERGCRTANWQTKVAAWLDAWQKP